MNGYAQFVAWLSLFFAHAGLAHVQIGLLRACGFEVAERYDKPYLATSLRDFWRRWNRWIVDWIRRYVFGPTREILLRHLRPRFGYFASSLAALVAFLFLGLLHDVARWAGDGYVAGLRWTIAFALFAATAIIETAFARSRLARFVERSLPDWLVILCQRVVFWHVALAVLWIAWAVVSDGRLPVGLRVVLGVDPSF